MHIIEVGVNYQVAPLEIREKLTFSDNNITKAMNTLNEQYEVLENIIISTCNRTEIFAVVNELEDGITSIEQFFIDWFQVKEEEVIPYVKNVTDGEAIKHLFRLATGLDSMVVGETQILGQLRDSFLIAQKINATGKVFNELFKRVITFAKYAHRSTGVSQQAVSVSYVAVELSKKIFDDLKDKHVIILGAGEMAELALKNLYGAGVKNITVVNRTVENAKKLGEKFSANIARMDQLYDVMQHGDILISSTSSESLVLTKEIVQSIQKQRKGKLLFLIDIAVPRDIDREVAELESVYLYDVDDLKHVVDENLEARKKEASIVETQIAAELTSFNHWINLLDAVPAIKALREKALSIQEKTLESIYRKMPDLTEREVKILKKHTKSIIHQLLEEPVKKVKEFSEDEQSKEDVELFKEIFGLKETQSRKKMDENKQFIIKHNWETTQ